ncbi:E3 ubiquitin-protein ligase Nedd-4 [Escovopsis weberi]|uniref:E3 ubiquitin-protein ligase Nedd-4 n=1 Tax=Escovopsis weberi TaxID=150374 RepID=A0A0M8N074_ESCWE|nr:E3 ubiquitin-protein ligase Nedd-4 [Escovopsis weberi]
MASRSGPLDGTHESKGAGRRNQSDISNGDSDSDYSDEESDGNDRGDIRDCGAPADSKSDGTNSSSPPGGFDTTPFPEDAPQGYTVRFIFHSAWDLPVADFHTGSADPYIIATLRGIRKRNEDDPDLRHRTSTQRRTLTPAWNEEWVVSNVPPTGFSLKCRLYDEDTNDKDDRLGNVTVKFGALPDDWEGIPYPGREFAAKKRVMSKRAYVLKGISNALHGGHITPKLRISIQVLGRSAPPFAQTCTLGPTTWIKHYSPMIGRLVGTKVNADEHDDEKGDDADGDRKSQKYESMQLRGPVPSRLYHRYVEFRPIIGPMFASTGVRGTILNKALHKQHNRIYNFNPSTERGAFRACSEEASVQFLRMAHFDEGGRIFTYVLSLDGLLRFTETGKEFGIDLLSKHTMHSDAEKYIACSGEFFIRRLQHPDASEDQEPRQETHPPSDHVPGGPPAHSPPPNPAYYQLFIDNDSGTYRPDKSVMPDLKAFLKANFPGLGIVVMTMDDERVQRLKEEQRSIKKKEGRMLHVVMNKSSSSSLSSVESELDARDHTWELGRKSKKEAAYSAMIKPDLEHLKQAVEKT